MDNRNIISFHNRVVHLKKLVRKGWTLRNVPNPESVAEHVYGVSMLALPIARERNLDVEKVLTIALIHEVCEVITGDITPHDNIPVEKKQQMETDAAAEILKPIDPNGELLELWKDFEYERTPEGKLVKQLDRIEMVMQAADYEKQYDVDLEEFFRFTGEKITDPELEEIYRQILDSRR